LWVQKKPDYRSGCREGGGQLSHNAGALGTQQQLEKKTKRARKQKTVARTDMKRANPDKSITDRRAKKKRVFLGRRKDKLQPPQRGEAGRKNGASERSGLNLKAELQESDRMQRGIEEGKILQEPRGGKRAA